MHQTSRNIKYIKFQDPKTKWDGAIKSQNILQNWKQILLRKKIESAAADRSITLHSCQSFRIDS